MPKELEAGRIANFGTSACAQCLITCSEPKACRTAGAGAQVDVSGLPKRLPELCAMQRALLVRKEPERSELPCDPWVCTCQPLSSPMVSPGGRLFIQASLQWKTAWRLIYSPRLQLRLAAQHDVLLHLLLSPRTAFFICIDVRGLNGVSLKTFFRRMQGEGPTLLLLQDLRVGRR